jgi:hypothetical protein
MGFEERVNDRCYRHLPPSLVVSLASYLNNLLPSSGKPGRLITIQDTLILVSCMPKMFPSDTCLDVKL